MVTNLEQKLTGVVTILTVLRISSFGHDMLEPKLNAT